MLEQKSTQQTLAAYARPLGFQRVYFLAGCLGDGNGLQHADPRLAVAETLERAELEELAA